MQQFAKDLQQTVNELQLRLANILDNNQEEQLAKENQFLKSHLADLQQEIELLHKQKSSVDSSREQPSIKLREEIAALKRE